MFIIKNNIIQHVNAVDIQPFIDEGGYEFLDDDKNVIAEKDLQACIDKEIAAHTGTAGSFDEMIEQLKAQGIQIKEG